MLRERLQGLQVIVVIVRLSEGSVTGCLRAFWQEGHRLPALWNSNLLQR